MLCCNMANQAANISGPISPHESYCKGFAKLRQSILYKELGSLKVLTLVQTIMLANQLATCETEIA